MFLQKLPWLLLLLALMPISGMELTAQHAHEEIQEKVAHLEAVAKDIKHFPDELLLNFLRPLLDGEGQTDAEKSRVATVHVRKFMKVFPQFYGDEHATRFVMSNLAQRYARGNMIDAAAELHTVGAAQWLAHTVTKAGEDYATNKQIQDDTFSALMFAIDKKKDYKVHFLFQYLPQVFPIVINKLWDHHPDQYSFGYGGISPLMLAAARNRLELVRFLLKIKGINVNLSDRYSTTAIIFAAESGNPAIVRLLIDAKADVNASTGSSYTALMKTFHGSYYVQGHCSNCHFFHSREVACDEAKASQLSIMDQLIVAGADVNEKNVSGNTVLLWAIWARNSNAVRRLLAVPGIDVNINSGSENYSSPLKVAKELKTPDGEIMVQLLKDHGAQ